jgi:uncharacterized membrane protein YhaH (DUF805 family)
MTTIDTSAQTPVPNPPIWNVALRWGLIFGGLSIVTSLLMYLLGYNPLAGGMSGMVIVFLISLAIAAAVVAMAVRQYRDQVNGGLITFGQALLISIVVAVTGSLIGQVWEYIMNTVIAPGRMEEMKEAFIESWGDMMSEEQLEQALTQFDQSPSIMSIFTNGLFGGAFIGLLVGLAVAAVMKRTPAVRDRV